jgi:hypothetical protein
MRPPDTEAREEAAWTAFVQALAGHLAAQWPAMHERLGGRTAEFVQIATQQATQRGWSQAAAVARFVNLCFVWGPSFQDKPGFDWAQRLLAAPPPDDEWAVSHRLMQRSLLELQRLPEARIDAATLAAADARLVERFGQLGRRGALHPPEPPTLPRQACDLEALELRLLQAAVDTHYVFAAGQWQRQPLPAQPPLRVDMAHALPPRVAVLANPAGQPPQARLQLRTRSLGVCDGNVHPALHCAGTHGLWRWAGHETRALSWPVHALAQPAAAAGPGTAVAEETSPDIYKLEVQVCGLRDDGDSLGSQSTQLWAWPAEQWWVEIKREAASAQPVVAGRSPAQPARTACRVESDGQPRDARGLRRGFEQGLDAATDGALQRLLAVLEGIDGLSAPRLDGLLAPLAGRAALTWGWCLDPMGMGAAPFMRLLGEIEMQACQAALVAEGELAFDDGRARLVLRCEAAAPLSVTLRREGAAVPLLASLQPARRQFALPWTAELTPLATATGTLMQAAGPCTGALVGEAGLRPRTSGGSGFEWFATLRLEAASLPLRLFDPTLGTRQSTHRLWDAQPLLDWSLG